VSGDSVLGNGMHSIRLLRILKVFFSFSKSVILLDVLVLSFKHLMNTLLVLIVFFYIYSIVGNNLFPYLKRRSYGISNDANFSSLSLSMFTLLAVSTGENISKILYDSVKTNMPDDVCFPINSYEDFTRYGSQFIGCGKADAYWYYLTFTVIFSYTLLNMFTGIIIQSFHLRASLAASLVKTSDIRNFFALWEAIDPEGVSMLPWLDAKMLLYLLDPPLGLQLKARTERMVNDLWVSLKLPLYRPQGSKKIYVHAYDMALALAKLTVQLDTGYLE
jgi:hypothetical protein